jgi:hypothetical protein
MRECDWSYKSHISKDVGNKFWRCCLVRLLIMWGVTQYRSVKSAYFFHYVQSLCVDMNYVQSGKNGTHEQQGWVQKFSTIVKDTSPLVKLLCGL